MLKLKYLKFKEKYYLTLIGLLGMLGFLMACTSSKKSNNSSRNDSFVAPKDTVILTKYGIRPTDYEKIEFPEKNK